MSDSKIFCAAPWTNTHLYWDGRYGSCCYEAHPPIGERFDLNQHTLTQWRNSPTMENFRQRMLGKEPLSECQFCYHEEKHGHESKRIKENFKVGIFTKEAFEKSFQYSKWNETFINHKDSDPYDWHVDFGNECNLACKMCAPSASSKIGYYYDKWNIQFDRADNWTNDPIKWKQFLHNVDSSEKIFRIHVMGGEPTISKKFLEFVERLVDLKRTHLSLSFVTNGTIINQKLIEQLSLFSLVNIEISLESIRKNNEYIRQGSNTEQVLENINWYRNNTNFQIVLRSVPQFLSINTYSEFILWAFEQKLSIQSIPLSFPPFLHVNLLTEDLKEKYINEITQVRKLIDQQSPDKFETISTGRDISRLPQLLIRECSSITNLLSTPEPKNVDKLRYDLVNWLIRWDKEFGFDAKKLYPEYGSFLDNYGYEI